MVLNRNEEWAQWEETMKRLGIHSVLLLLAHLLSQLRSFLDLALSLRAEAVRSVNAQLGCASGCAAFSAWESFWDTHDKHCWQNTLWISMHIIKE